MWNTCMEVWWYKISRLFSVIRYVEYLLRDWSIYFFFRSSVSSIKSFQREIWEKAIDGINDYSFPICRLRPSSIGDLRRSQENVVDTDSFRCIIHALTFRPNNSLHLTWNWPSFTIEFPAEILLGNPWSCWCWQNKRYSREFLITSINNVSHLGDKDRERHANFTEISFQFIHVSVIVV